MHEALALAQQAVGLCDPNPRVGCVIAAADGRVIGRGHTQQAGAAHAEVMALRDAAARGERARGATAYVTLEPCSHHGRTPPCCEALVAAGLARVVVAVGDPNPRVAGEGIARLRAAGIAVEVSLLAEAARELNIGFFSRMERGQPWLRMKAAVSLDGRSALRERRQPVDHRPGRPHRRPRLAQAGRSGADRRRYRARRQPAAGREARHHGPPADARRRRLALAMPADARILDAPGHRARLCRGPGSPSVSRRLQARGAEVALVPDRAPRSTCARCSQDLGSARHQRTARRGRRKLNGSFVREGLVDEWLVYMAPRLLGSGRDLAAFGPLQSLDEQRELRLHAVDRVGADLRLLLRQPARRPADAATIASCSPVSSLASARSSRRALGADASFGKRLTLQTPPGYLEDAQPGDSIALNGACMTLTSFDATSESLHDRDLGRKPRQDGRSRRARPGQSREGAARARPPRRPPRQRPRRRRRPRHPLRAGRRVVGTARARAGRAGALPRVQGLDHRQRRQPDRQPRRATARRLRVRDQPDRAHAAGHDARRSRTSGSSVNLEIDLIARYVERMLERSAEQRAQTSANTSTSALRPLTRTAGSASQPVGRGEPRVRRAADQRYGAEVLVQRLDARRDVDRVADQRIDHALAAADVAGDHAAAVDADAVAQFGLARRAPLRVPGVEPAPISRAAATAASAWRGSSTGAPNTASISSPMNCRTRPPWPRIAASISPK